MRYYKCKSCLYDWLQIYSLFADRLKKCPKCNSKDVKLREIDEVI